MTTQTEQQGRTVAARKARHLNSLRRKAPAMVEALQELGYTVTGPQGECIPVRVKGRRGNGPTDSQIDVITYFATGHISGRTPKTPTYDVCVKRGWIVVIDDFPFHAATEAGKVAAGIPASASYPKLSR